MIEMHDVDTHTDIFDTQISFRFRFLTSPQISFRFRFLTSPQPSCAAVFFTLLAWFSVKAWGFLWVKSETTLHPHMVARINVRHGYEGVLPEICWVLVKIFVWNLFVSWENKGGSVCSYLVFTHVREREKIKKKEKKKRRQFITPFAELYILYIWLKFKRGI